MTIEPIIIPLSKSKIKRLVAILAICLTIGILLLVFRSFMNASFDALFIIAISSIGLITLVPKLVDKRPGLVINSKGLVSNVSAMSNGFIAWEDIAVFHTARLKGVEIILITVSNPQAYIDRETNRLIKKAMQFNYNMYKTPLILSTGALACDVPALLKILHRELGTSRGIEALGNKS